MVSEELKNKMLNDKKNWLLVISEPGAMHYHYSTETEIFRIIVPTGIDGEIKIIKKGDKNANNVKGKTNRL